MVINLRELRKEKGLTQGQLATAAKLHRITIAKYEAGKVSPTLESAQRLADALEVPIERLTRKAG